MQVSNPIYYAIFTISDCTYPFIVFNSKVSKYPFDRMVGAARKEFLETDNLQSLAHFSPNMTYHNASPLKHFTNYYWMYHFLTSNKSKRAFAKMYQCENFGVSFQEFYESFWSNSQKNPMHFPLNTYWISHINVYLLGIRKGFRFKLFSCFTLDFCNSVTKLQRWYAYY